MNLPSEPLDPRQRAGTTKRERTRTALLEAGMRLIEERGEDVRMEDIAEAAGVGIATAYNHFHTKQELIGQIYSYVFGELSEDSAATSDIFVATDTYIRRLASIAGRHRLVTTARLISDPGVELKEVDLLGSLISTGQQRGIFKLDVSAKDVASYHVMALLIRVATHPDESADKTADLVISQILPVLR